MVLKEKRGGKRLLFFDEVWKNERFFGINPSKLGKIKKRN